MRLILLTALVLPSPMLWSHANAQTGQGRLTGIVADVQHAVLPGVTVVATSPALVGEQIAVTQSDGAYLFPSLSRSTPSWRSRRAGFED